MIKKKIEPLEKELQELTQPSEPIENEDGSPV
jgi:hypothetical protein